MSNFSMKVATSVAILGGIVASAVSASAALNLPTQSCAYMFNSNMKLGSRGADVKNLQTVLNMYPQTKVDGTGAGSAGQETTYFGLATRAAVNNFQKLHLVELGITAPTGNVFAGTRGLLNQVCSATPSTVPPVTGLPAGCTSTSGFSPVTGASCATGVVTPTSGPVSAMLTASQPTNMIVAGQSGALLANIAFTGNGTVTNMQLQRIGVSADATLVNVYLYDGNTRITDAASVVTGGYINFNSSTGLFTVNGSRTISVRADILSTANGQSVGVKLNSVTAGGAATTYTNVIGNQLTIANVDTATASLGTISNSAALFVDAGTTQYNVWSDSIAIGIRSVNMRAATFKFVGSAPVDSLANINLYVDGTKVAGPTSISAINNNKVTFDLGATPYLLTTGSHTLDVRADIVKGSFRTITMSIENVSDLMLEDSQLAGVNISATFNGTAFTQSAATYNQITVNKGSVTVNVDPAFTANKVTGGATNVPVGQFTMKAYGEDVKVSTILVDLATTTNASLTTFNNVSLFVNGGQVGSSQNLTLTSPVAGLTFNLGSSLIIPAGSTVTFTVKADIVDASGNAYTSGTVAAVIGGVPNNAQGQSSFELVSVAGSAITGNVLTITSGAGTFARTSGFTSKTVAPNTVGVKIGSFTLQANSAESIKVNSVGVLPVVTGSSTTGSNTIANYSNITLKSGSTVLGTPVGNPSAGTTTFSFTDITIAANGTQTFDVYADIGGNATSTGVTPAIYTDMAVTSRGAVSNTTVVSSATGSGAVTSSTVSSLSASSLQSSSPVTQFVVGGSTFGIATFRLNTATAGTQATVREMRFATTGTDAVESITVGGVTSTVLGSGVSATTTVSGLNIVVGSTGTDVPVTVKFSGFQGTTNGGSLLTSVASVGITLSYVEAVSGSGTVITSLTQVPSNAMSLVASKPVVTVGAGNTDTLVLGAENKVGEFTVTADANGKIAVATTTFSLSTIGVTGGFFNTFRIADGATTISSGSVSTTTASNAIVAFTPNYEISAGTSKTFSLFAFVGGTAVSGITPYVASSITSAGFEWRDVIGGGTYFAGTNIYNFPTSSFSTKR